MNEIADRLGMEVEYRDVPFDNITQGLTVHHFDEEAFAALADGSLDGVIHDLPASQHAVDDSGGSLEIVEVSSTGEHYGIAFPKDSELVKPVNGALAEIKQDGTYEEIYERWIGRPPEDIP